MNEKFIARQPIFDARLKVYAYELLFRGGPQNFYQPRANASSSVIADSITLFDLDQLVGHARAFINADELALRLGAVRLLPPERIVVEILESVPPTEEIVSICRELRAAGYLLALDDFVDSPQIQPLVELANFLKIDFQQFDRDECRELTQKHNRKDLFLLAEKLETRADLDDARHMGCTYFQGYFFCKPSMVETREIPGNKLIQLQLLSAVSAPEMDYLQIELLLQQEPSLLYRLLRYLNSPALGLRSEVTSIRHAITLLGTDEFRRWASIFALISMGNGHPPELLRTALTRAFFCEELSNAAGLSDKSPRLFLMGLLSISDALLDKPMKEVLNSVPVTEDVKTALSGGDNRLRDVFEMVLALERAEWPKLSSCSEKLGCAEENVPHSYQAAIKKAAAVQA